MRRFQAPPAARAAAAVEPGHAVRLARRSTCPRRASRAWRSGSPRPRAGLGLEEVVVRARHRRPGHRRAARPGPAPRRDRPARGCRCARTDPPTEPLQPLSTSTAAEGAAARAGAARSTRTRSSGCSRRRATASGRAPAGASSSSTTSTTTARLVPVDRAGGREHAPTSSSASCPQLTPTLPRGHDAGRPARRPDRGAGRRSPSPSAGASTPRSTSPSRCGVPLEWFALSPGARIAMDSGTENMDWIARRAAPASSSSPRPAARSTSSSPASTSAPSRTGTPRRRCSCTPGASW